MADVKNRNGNGTIVYEVASLKDVTARHKLPGLCAEYRRLSDERAAVDTAMKAVKEDIDTVARKARIASSVAGDGWLLSRTTSTRKTLSKERLLEKGVPMATIEYATVESSSTYYRVLNREAE